MLQRHILIGGLIIYGLVACSEQTANTKFSGRSGDPKLSDSANAEANSPRVTEEDPLPVNAQAETDTDISATDTETSATDTEISQTNTSTSSSTSTSTSTIVSNPNDPLGTDFGFYCSEILPGDLQVVVKNLPAKVVIGTDPNIVYSVPYQLEFTNNTEKTFCITRGANKPEYTLYTVIPNLSFLQGRTGFEEYQRNLLVYLDAVKHSVLYLVGKSKGIVNTYVHANGNTAQNQTLAYFYGYFKSKPDGTPGAGFSGSSNFGSIQFVQGSAGSPYVPSQWKDKGKTSPLPYNQKLYEYEP